MNLDSTASLQINKPIEVVYEAIIDPKVMTNYFISESNGRLDAGIDIWWSFPEFEGKFPLSNINLETNRSISFIWDPETVVTIELKAFNRTDTIVKVSEKGKQLNEENLKWLISNTAGWANFLASMKAYLEYGVQLRKGAYDFMRE